MERRLPTPRRLAQATLLLLSVTHAAENTTAHIESLDGNTTGPSSIRQNSSSERRLPFFLNLTALRNFTTHAANRSGHAARARLRDVYSSHLRPAGERARHAAALGTDAAVRRLRSAPRAFLRWLDGVRRSMWAAMMEQLREWLESAREYGGEAKTSARTLWRTFMRRDRAVSRVLRKGAARQWYELLRVRRKASKKQLKDAYRKLAKRVHPDKTKDDRAEKAFNVLRDAFDLLSDSDQRARYDKELQRADEILAQKRREQRRKAKQIALKALRDGARFAKLVAAALFEQAQEHPRIAIGVIAVLGLLLSPS